MPEDVGVIGIGLVGTALARRLLGAGWGVVGHDVDPQARARLVALGGQTAPTAAAVASRVQRLLLSLPDSHVVRQVVEGPEGVAAARPRPRYVVDTTTGDPQAVTALAARLQQHGIAYLDATVSGSSQQVAEGQCVWLVGAEAEDLEACRDLLQQVSPRLFHVGPPGSGSRAKLASNLVLGLNRLALAEGLAFAESLGLDLLALLEVLRTSPAASAVMEAKGRKMVDGDFAPQARLRQHLKDVRLILQCARAAGQGLPLTQVHRQILEAAVQAGDGDLDNAAVIRQLRRQR